MENWVVKNNVSLRTKMDFVLVNVWTDVDINTNKEKGVFGQKGIDNLYHSLHQALIIPNIIIKTLDLSSNADFQTGGQHIDTNTSGINLIAFVSTINHNYGNPLLYSYTQNLLSEKGSY